MNIFKLADKFEKKLKALAADPVPPQRTPLEKIYAIYFAAKKLYENRNIEINFVGSPIETDPVLKQLIPTIEEVYSLATKFYSDASKYGLTAATHQNYVNQIKPKVDLLNGILKYSNPRLNKMRSGSDSLVYNFENYNPTTGVQKKTK